MNDLIKIKKYYGENMMHLCRRLFPTLLEQEGLLFSLLDSNFAYSKFLYEDIVSQGLEDNFKNYIYSLVDLEPEKIITDKTPEELLEEAGYILYECQTEEDIKKFRKYYAPNEELCTFNGGRLNSCYVFFAVKKDIDKIKREDFPNPQRQDEYGISIISIQFTKGKYNTLSIKNRYNHRVNNADSTFVNNLDNIIPGLTQSFEKHYNLNITQNNTRFFELIGYVKAQDGKYYKYNYEINNTYYCPDNIIIKNFQINTDYQEREKYLIIDYFVIDLVNKTIKILDPYITDSFVEGLKNIKKISITKTKEGKVIDLTLENNQKAFIEIDKYNRIIKYRNDSITKIKHNFLSINKELKEIILPNVKEIGVFFLGSNIKLEKILLPNVEQIGSSFLVFNKELRELNLPKIKTIGDIFMSTNDEIKEIMLPNVKEIGYLFLRSNTKVKKVILPKVKIIGEYFLSDNIYLEDLQMPLVEEIENNFLNENTCLKEINLPKLRTVGNSFLFKNKQIKKVNLPNLEIIGEHFLPNNQELEELSLPQVKEIGIYFLINNDKLKNISLPKLSHNRKHENILQMRILKI